jgi:TRAP-type C4-dicarboxylate transport system permease small subunit
MTTVNKRLQQLVEILLMTFLSGMVLLTFTDVIGRRVFNTPVFGAHDITEHLMAVIVFSGLPLLTANRAHLSIDLFDRWLLQPQWRIWHYFVNGLIAAVLALIAYEFAVSVQEANDMREVSQALGIPRAWMYAYLAITSGLAALAALTAGLPTHHEGNEA